MRAPSVRVPPFSYAISKYVFAEPVGLPSALRVWATLIQSSSPWKIFSPACAYLLPWPPSSASSPGAEIFATSSKSPSGSGWPTNPIGPGRARSTE